MLGISYSSFNVIAIKAIQEQQEKIDTQQTQIEELKKQNEMQQFQFAELKKEIESLKRKK